MARPSTPKLPVSKTLISEVLQRVSNAKTKAKKIEILQEYKSPALTKFFFATSQRVSLLSSPTARLLTPPWTAPRVLNTSCSSLSSVLLTSLSPRLSTVLSTSVAPAAPAPLSNRSRKKLCGSNFLKHCTKKRQRFSTLLRTRS